MKRKIICVLLVLCTLFSLVFTGTVVSAEETEKQYSDVLGDLNKDSSFNTGDYPKVTDTTHKDYATVKVIQIAESTDKELLIYTYNPSHDFELTQIAMWDEFSSNGENFTPELYDLRLVSSSSVFRKYVVENYTVSSETYRYYNISELFRKFDSTVDIGIDNGATTEKAIAVGQQWCAYWLNNQVNYEMITFDVVEITPVLNDHLAFNNGLTWGSLVGNSQSGHLHYIAFNVDNYNVDEIFDADVSFKYSPYTTYIGLGYSGEPEYTYGDNWPQKKVYLSEYEKESFTGSGLFSKSFEWNQISSTSDFLKSMEKANLSEQTINTLENAQWVFCYALSDFESQTYGSDLSAYTIQKGTKYTDVTVLRLHFRVKNQTFNLGAVMDKTEADNVPGNNGTLDIDFDFSRLEEIIKIIFLVIGILILVSCLSFVAPILSVVINIVVKGLSFILKVVISIIALPFKLLSGDKRKKP